MLLCTSRSMLPKVLFDRLNDNLVVLVLSQTRYHNHTYNPLNVLNSNRKTTPVDRILACPVSQHVLGREGGLVAC